MYIFEVDQDIICFQAGSSVRVLFMICWISLSIIDCFLKLYLDIKIK